MTAKHTPTPWEVTSTLGQLAITRPHKTIGIAFDTVCRMESNRDGSIDAELNAEFIVRAVNSHEALLEIVKTYKVRLDEQYDEENCDEMEHIEKAIAQAEGKS